MLSRILCKDRVLSRTPRKHAGAPTTATVPHQHETATVPLDWGSTIQTGQRIHANRYGGLSGVEARPGPNPLRRLLHQPPTDRVVVQVLHHGTDGGGLQHMAIVPTAALPTAVVHFSVGLNILQPFQKGRGQARRTSLFGLAEDDERAAARMLSRCPCQHPTLAQDPRKHGTRRRSTMFDTKPLLCSNDRPRGRIPPTNDRTVLAFGTVR
jgi:hypothetical protein